MVGYTCDQDHASPIHIGNSLQTKEIADFPDTCTHNQMKRFTLYEFFSIFVSAKIYSNVLFGTLDLFQCPIITI